MEERERCYSFILSRTPHETAIVFILIVKHEYLTDSMVARWPPGHLGVHSRKLSNVPPTNPHWARAVGYGPFSLCVIRKEGLCPSSGAIIGCWLKQRSLRSVIGWVTKIYYLEHLRASEGNYNISIVVETIKKDSMDNINFIIEKSSYKPPTSNILCDPNYLARHYLF
jgi:hypothetical protein